jgi:hypothetical protein
LGLARGLRVYIYSRYLPLAWRLVGLSPQGAVGAGLLLLTPSRDLCFLHFFALLATCVAAGSFMAVGRVGAGLLLLTPSRGLCFLHFFALLATCVVVHVRGTGLVPGCYCLRYLGFNVG